MQCKSLELKGLEYLPCCQSPNKPVKYKGTEIPSDPSSKTTQKMCGFYHKSYPPVPVRAYVSLKRQGIKNF